jgi:serine/threonine protein kinase
MPLSVGTRLGPYEIVAAIGAGGMGEVFRARDTRLNRDVALKILPDAFAHDADRMARFTREAQTLAALNHPHIAHIHGIEESDGVRALVMELVEGDDLAQLIARGPADLMNSPTMTTPARLRRGFGEAGTEIGMILGTAAYMAPEQAKGKAVDKRADIFAQAFDAERGALSGQPATIAADVRVIESQRGVFASVSRTGTIAWAVARAAHARFAWYDREGRRLDTVPIEEGDLQQPTISPDGRRLLFTRVANGTADIFLHDFRARNSRRVTDNPDYDEVALWSPDGAEMIQMSSDKGQNALMRSALDGSAAPVELIRGTSQLGARAWSPDRRYVLVQNDAPGSGTDMFVLSPDNPSTVTPLVTGPGNDGDSAAFSPDGRWIVFTSQRTGGGEVYVARFRGEQSPPALGGRPIQISANGGWVLPRGWWRDGKEIVFGSPDGQVMAVTVDVRGESISASQPIALFRLPSSQSGATMTPDGDRFIVSEYPNAAGQTIHVLTNWHARLNAGR